jgi:hypothetical protein
MELQGQGDEAPVSYTLTLYFSVFQPHDDIAFPMCKYTH